jgi:hypothetical protein
MTVSRLFFRRHVHKLERSTIFDGSNDASGWQETGTLFVCIVPQNSQYFGMSGENSRQIEIVLKPLSG